MTPLPRVRALGVPRLTAGLAPGTALSLRDHHRTHGSLPRLDARALVALAEETGLRGRGGAAFPVARKLRAVAAYAGPRGVIVNGCEGEPASRKDAVLLSLAPHLVLDGARLAARALGVRGVTVGVTRPEAERAVRRALGDRRMRGHVVRLPERMVSGEASALLSAVRGGRPLPHGRRVHAAEEGVLLANTETYAQLAVAARLGAERYGAGTLLLTVSGGVPEAAVVEVPVGAPLAYVLHALGADPGLPGVLVGGYHGAWLGAEAARDCVLSPSALPLGAGAVLPLPAATCPLGETLRVARWLAAESALQCGPCRLGLPALAASLEATLRGAAPAPVEAGYGLRGRGACKHPDGAARFVLSALSVFTDDLAAHALSGGCGRPVRESLPLPGPPTATARLTVDWTLCEAHGLCADLLPLSPDGYPSTTSTPLPPELRDRARQAVRTCPALALRLERQG
ncbi:NADH-ubiquinone oxidoreductase-F iron-sulfur binding region domain-containing protein [Streptomyces sp. NPDC051940]|uniref:NADH-ubiquinone oxidoreductase-F iron-sulfur binding region domain-containing protein n=1 Tax=Streptomyces sp. NPDC051940 TaxID=3155675 RepID=UPI003442EC8B